MTQPPTQSAEASWQAGLADLLAFEALQSHPDPVKLKTAAAHLFDSLKRNPDQVQPYVCLAYISHILDDKATSLAYLALAEGIDPAFGPLQALKAELG